MGREEMGLLSLLRPGSLARPLLLLISACRHREKTQLKLAKVRPRKERQRPIA